MANYSIYNDINVEDIKSDLLKVFKSPNPFSIYMNSKNVKDKFSGFINSLSDKISNWFKLEDDSSTFVFQIYKSSSYDKVWIEILDNYLRDSKNFDLLSYLYYVKTLNKDKQYLAKWLFKLYKKENPEDIKKFLVKYNSWVSFEKVEKLFNDFSIWTIELTINLREEFVEHFIEKVYYNLPIWKREIFLDNFILKINKSTIDFSDLTKIVLKIINSYPFWEKREILEKTVSTEYFTPVKLLIDDLIKNYLSIRSNFYLEASSILSSLSSVDRSLFWQYIKIQMIDVYYPNVRYLFYDFSSNNFVDKNLYTSLKWDFKIIKNSISPEAEYLYWDYNEINDLKTIILELSDNVFSSFLLPVVYYIISEQLSIPKRDLYKMKYLLLYIFSSNYSEYKDIYLFFNQLEVFLNYDKKSNIIGKIQVGFSIILLLFISMFLAYLYLPIWVFLWIFLLSVVKYFEIWYPNMFYNQKWNVWIKFFWILFLCVSTYFWFQNFDKVKEDSSALVQNIENLWSIPTRDIIDWGAHYIKASILEFSRWGR
jgi:hypothetical protein